MDKASWTVAQNVPPGVQRSFYFLQVLSTLLMAVRQPLLAHYQKLEACIHS